LILIAAAVLRGLFFVGFGLGDDLGYIGHADRILAGGYPPLDPLNQYSYRPLLLLLFAGGIALFGHTDLGVVAPVLLSSLVTTALVFVFVRDLIDPAAAWWCALLYAFEPFNVVNSTTMTNDVILSCLTFASLGMFVLADRSSAARKSGSLFAASALLMLAAFLVKISFVPVVSAIALYSVVVLCRRPEAVLSRHTVFYATLLLGGFCVCLAYYLKTGDLLWQFKSETFYYETNKPEWYRAGGIDYAALMWQYPRSLFSMSGYPAFRYFDHGFLFWLVLPASVMVLLRRGNEFLKLLIATGCIVFAFFQFYPQYLWPRYLPLVRQERYLEMLLPAAVIVAGTTLHSLSRRHRILAVSILGFLLVDSVVEAGRRFTQYNDSQQDMRELARYAGSTIARTGGRLAVDLPAKNALAFYLRASGVDIEEVSANQLKDLRQCYVAVGGGRSFWWSPDQVVDINSDAPPPHWILRYEVRARKRPWRSSNLRVYYVSEPLEGLVPTVRFATGGPLAPVLAGLAQAAYPDGFDGNAVPLAAGTQIPDLDNAAPLPAPLAN
jgi:4-amino-4-deoxy-L-arabinose transferase-like glycosyltransferase